VQIGSRKRPESGVDKKFSIFLIQVGVFSKKMRRDSMELEKTRFFYDPVVGFAEIFRRDSMGRKKRDFFRESLSDFSFFADIPSVRKRRGLRMPRKNCEFLRNPLPDSKKSADIPYVRKLSSDVQGASGGKNFENFPKTVVLKPGSRGRNYKETMEDLTMT